MKLRTIFFAAAFVATALPALAHAFLEHASPAAGARLRVSPAKLELHFSEDLDAPFSDVRVSDGDGRNMAVGRSLASGSELDLPLKKLSPGQYRVTWHVVSVDTHRSEGKYDFTVIP